MAMLKNKIMKLEKSDLYIVLILLLFSILVRLPLLSYPIDGDAVRYAELAKNLVEKHSYEWYNPEKGAEVIDTEKPPLHPLVSSVFYLVTDKASLSVKYSDYLFSSLTICALYIILRLYMISKPGSILGALLLLFNPWFFYFTTLGLSESLAIFLLTAGFFLIQFSNQKNWKYYLGTLLIGLSAITRAIFIVFVGMFCLYFLYNIWRKKEIKKNITAIIITISPYVLLSIIYIFVQNTTAYLGYAATFTSESTSSWLYVILLHLAVIPITFLFLIPAAAMVVWAFRKIGKDSKDLYRLFIFTFISLAAVFLIIVITSKYFDVFNALNPNNADWGLIRGLISSRPRIFMVFIPLFIVLSLKTDYGKYSKIVRKYLWISLGFSVVLSIILSFGSVQSIITEKVYFPETAMMRLDNRAQAIDWINLNLPPNAILYGMLREPGSSNAYDPESQAMTWLNVFINERFRDDIMYYNINSTVDIRSGGYLLTQCKDSPTGLQIVYSTRSEPKVCVSKS